tara:strand:- start:2085 stop:2387 length:303 start_codon:yes stop_codon:yes gene_type:complete
MDRELLLELKEFLAERMVDNMSTEDLEEYVQDDLFKYFDKLGEHEFLNEAENYWGEHLGGVIDDLQDYIKCDFKKDKGTTTYSLEVGESISFPVHGSDEV